MRFLVLALLAGHSLLVFGQADSTRVDTIAVEREYTVLPGMNPMSARRSSHATLDASLNQTAQVNLGISVMNSVRGQVPGMYIDPFYQVDTLTWRDLSPQVVIDGIPFGSNMVGYHNLNAFEYENMYMMLGKNGTIPYGGAGNRGAIVMQSRTGEGYSKPTFDLNSYTTYSWGEGSTASRWQLSNSVGYGQDFGKVDLRVTANYIAQPPGTNPNGLPDYFRFKINTGFSTGKFKARLILNTNSGSHTETYSYTTPIVFEGSSQYTDNLAQANLMLSYALTDWLSISSQASQTTIAIESNRLTNWSDITRKSDNIYDAGNILLSVNKKLSTAISLSGTLGILANHAITKNTAIYSTLLDLSNSSTNPLPVPVSGEFYMESKSATNSILYTTEIGFKDKLFAGINFRRDFVDLYNDSEAFNAYSFFGAYRFDHLIDRSGNVLSFAKVRSSFGYNDNGVDYTNPKPGNLNMYSYSRRTSSFEAGFDAAFLKDRIHFMGNFYQNTSFAADVSVSPAPIDPVTGYTHTILNLADNNTTVSGVEFLVRMRVWEGKNSNVTTQLIAGWNNVERNQFWPSSVPDWTGGWLNQFSMGRFTASMLIDISAGGYFIPVNPSLSLVKALPFTRPSPSDTTVSAADYGIIINSLGNYRQYYEDRTYIKLREVSVGYSFPVAERVKGFVSISLRNLVMLYTKSGEDPELSDPLSGLYPPNKSASVNFTLQF